MATAKPAQTTTDRTQDAIASALRTLEAEGSGVDALKGALHDGLGRTLAVAVDTIRDAQGRVQIGSLMVPSTAAPTTHLQAVDQQTCRTSNHARIIF